MQTQVEADMTTDSRYDALRRSKMLTIRDVAEMLNVHVNSIRRWSNMGLLRVYRVGSRGDRRYRPEDVAQFLARDKNGAGHGDGTPNAA